MNGIPFFPHSFNLFLKFSPMSFNESINLLVRRLMANRIKKCKVLQYLLWKCHFQKNHQRFNETNDANIGLNKRKLRAISSYI